MEKQLPKNWVECSLSDVFEIVTGNTPSKSFPEYYGGNIPWVKPGDINKSTEIYNTEEFLSKEGFDKSRKIPKGSVMVTCIGNLGNVAIAGTELATNQQINTIVIPHEFINKKYVYYRSLTFKKWLVENSTSTTIAMVNKSNFEKLIFLLPPLPEQHRIVAKLDMLFAQLETIKTSMANIPLLLKDFRQQVLTQAVTGKLTEEWRKGKKLKSGLVEILNNRKQYYEDLTLESKKNGIKTPKKLDITDFEMFELSDDFKIPSYWEKANLKNIADLITDGEHATPKKTEDGYLLLSARNVQNGFISFKKVDYVPLEEYERIIKRCNPEHKDVLISCSGTVGRVSSVPKDLQFVMVRSAALVKFQSNKEISKFIEYTLRSDFGQSQINKLQKATAQANLFLAPIGKIVIPIPSVREQQEIVHRVERLFAKADAIEHQYKVLKASIDTLPQTLLHKAFKGELVPQLESDGDASELLEEIKALKDATGKVIKSKTNKKAAKKVKPYSETDEVLGMVAENKE